MCCVVYCCSLSVVWLCVRCLLLRVVIFVCCVLYVVCSLLVACCLLFVACCLMFVVCCPDVLFVD